MADELYYNGENLYKDEWFLDYDYTKEKKLRVKVSEKDWILDPKITNEVQMTVRKDGHGKFAFPKEHYAVLVECHSYIWEIKKAKAKRGVISQTFEENIAQLVTKSGMGNMEFKLGLRKDSNIEGIETLNDSDGFISIKHALVGVFNVHTYKPFLARLYKEGETYGYQKFPLKTKEDTKKILKRREKFTALKAEYEKAKAEGRTMKKSKCCAIM